MTLKWPLMTFKWPWDQKQGHHWIGLAKCFKNGPTFISPSPITLLLFTKNLCCKWVFRGFVAYGTPCSQSFQDKWVILYIFEKPRSRAFQKMSLEVIWRYQAEDTGENVKKIFWNFFWTLMNGRINSVKMSKILEKTVTWSETTLFHLIFAPKKLKIGWAC